jgi:hypothetical protein
MLAAYIVIMLCAVVLGVFTKRYGSRFGLLISVVSGLLLCVALTIWLNWRIKNGAYP